MRVLQRITGGVALIVLGLSLLVSSVGAQSASGGIGGRPANPDPANPRSQSIFIFTINKGETKSDTILVSNNSDRTRTIELYAVDGLVTNTGAFTCSQQSEAKMGMGAWMTLAKNSVTLAAGKTEKVDFSLAMPSNADVGEHDGCVVFQDAASAGQTTGNIHITTRQAIRVVATVPGDLHRNIVIESFSVDHKDGHQLYMLHLKNSGNVSADVDTAVTLTSLFGNKVYKNGGGYPVLANQKLDLSFENKQPPFFGGWYFANASITYDTRAGTFGTTDQQHLITKSADRKLIFVAPTVAGAFIMIFVLLIIVGFIAWLLLRRRDRLAALRTWHTYTVKHGDSLQSIASSHAVSWKKLATINALRAPYGLAAGQEIKVPTKEKKQPSPSKKKQAS